MISRNTISDSTTQIKGPYTRYRGPAVNNTGVLVKNAGGHIMGWVIVNPNTDPVFLKVYDKATAPTTGTDVPIATIEIPANQTYKQDINGYSQLDSTNGIGIAITAGAGDADNTAPTINCLVHIAYK